jgi:hypothetical protein
MANPLLDFVMSIVRDPDVAAHYASDPAGAIDAAHLTNVTSADVNALIPVVSESMPMATPHTGAEALAGDPAGNVWTSGAATAAFDDHLSAPAIDDAHSIVSNVIQQPDDSLHAGLDALDDHGVPSVTGIEDPTQFTHGVIDDAPLVGDAVDAIDTDWHHPVADDHPHIDPGFDIFN